MLKYFVAYEKSLEMESSNNSHFNMVRPLFKAELNHFK